MPPEIYSKEFYISEIIAESWRRYRDNFRAILIIVSIVYIPIYSALYFIFLNVSSENYFRLLFLFESLFGIIATIAIAILIKKEAKKTRIQ